MDSFTERILERAKAREKKLEEHFNNTGETPKIPLQEPNRLFKKYDNISNFTKSQPNLTECKKINSKDVASDSRLNTKVFYESSLKENLSDSNLPKSVRQSCTLVSSDSSPKSPTKTLNIQKENFNMEIKVSSTDNVRVEVEIEERDASDNEDKDADVSPVFGIKKINTDKFEKSNKSKDIDDKPVIRGDAKKCLQRLGQLYSGDDEISLSSPIHRTENTFNAEDPKEKEIHKTTSGLILGRLKALADTRNKWEDEVSGPTTKVTTKESPKKNIKPLAPKPPVDTRQYTPKYQAPKPPTNAHMFTKASSREASPEKATNIPLPKSPEKLSSSKTVEKCMGSPVTRSPIKERPGSSEIKQLAWDKAVIENLESQGFTRTNSNARLIYNYKSEENSKKDKRCGGKEENTIPEDEEQDNIEQPASKLSESTSDSVVKKNADVKNDKPSFIPKSPVKRTEVSNKVAQFESPSKGKDPALLSVSERKALFEKNKGAALIPKAAFAMSVPVKNVEKEIPASEIVKVKPPSPTKLKPELPKSHSPVVSSASKKKGVDSPATASIKQSGGIASKMRALLEKKTTISQSQINSSIKEQRQKEMNLLLNRFNNHKEEVGEEIEELSDDDDENISETTKMIAAKAVKIVQFKGSTSALSPPPPPPPLPVALKGGTTKRRSKGESPKVRQVLEDVKRIKVSPPKAGKIYPCLSDIEANTETEPDQSTPETTPDSSFDSNDSLAESDGPNTSFGREIMQVVCKNQSPATAMKKRPILDDSTASDISDVLDDMDDYLDEALAADDSDDYTEGPTPPKHGKRTPPRNTAAPSNSFHYKKYSPKSPMTRPKITPVKEIDSNMLKETELPTHIQDGDSVLPLTHTVSFYRKQQAQGSRTPVRQITRQQAVVEESPENESLVKDERKDVQAKIQELLEFVTKQQTVISQASQALNLCCSTIEFSGSSEQVEAERLLLVATQRRQAALHEIQRLRVEGTLHPEGGAPLEKGSLTISDISFPLKKEYVRALSAAGGKGHHVVCLVRYGENVIPTRLVSTVASPRDNPEMNLRVPGSVKLETIYSDFTVTVEVYTLQAQEEILSHEVKYHIAPKKGGSKMTPKKLLRPESKLIMPTIQSPAGPQAVRSPSFNLVGYVVFSLQGVSRTHWTLNNAPGMSPLEGSVQMKVHCELAMSVEHRGFLTMFDDVSGFGAWHRRWCLLKGSNISYWKYPDDEKKKAPIDTISLQTCSTKQVGPVTREICARPHTLLLEMVRPARPMDKDSLVTVCQGDKTIIRHLLSADTKEERNEWCDNLNKALRAIRLWGNTTKH